MVHSSTLTCLQLAAWGPGVCGRDRVVSALYSLFAAFAAEEQQRQQAGPLQGTTTRRGLVNPSELRQALSALPGPQQYRVGECAGWAGGCVAHLSLHMPKCAWHRQGSQVRW